jgi:hypothetical protein
MVHYVVKVPKDPSSFPNWTTPAKRSLDFYRHRTCIELAGGTISELWSTFVLQAAHCHPAVRHAVVALGALHEASWRSTIVHSTNFAVQEYSRAIRDVSSLSLNESNETFDVALLCCMLFAAFESLRGYYKSALTHISSGMKLVAAHEIDNEYVKRTSYSWGLIQPVFVCLDTQAMEVCDDLLPSTGVPLEKLNPLRLPETFTSIEEASKSFTIYRNHILHFFHRYERLLDPELIAEEAQDVRVEQVKLARYFHNWCDVFNRAQFETHHPQVLIIQMYITVVKMIATLIPSPHETKWDASMAYFNGLVELGEEFMRQQGISLTTHPNHGGLQHNGIQEDGCHSDISRRTNESKSQSTSTAPSSRSSESTFWDSGLSSQEASIKQTFTVTHGVVTPLYMVCTRCRDPTIRRRALRILQTCNRKEGIWDSAQSALVAERIIQIEETAAGGFVTDASHIPSQARIQQLETSFGPGKPGKIMYTMNGATPPITIVEHLSDGNVQGNWEAKEEAMRSRSFFSTRFAVLPRQTLLS